MFHTRWHKNAAVALATLLSLSLEPSFHHHETVQREGGGEGGSVGFRCTLAKIQSKKNFFIQNILFLGFHKKLLTGVWSVFT